jgi:hypothetical protein
VNDKKINSQGQQGRGHDSPPCKDSRFVTILAWVFIGFFGYSVISTLVQGIVFYITPPLELLGRFFPDLDIRMFLPPAFIYFAEHIHGFLSVTFVVSLVALFVSFAFYKRRNWARISMAVFMVATIVFSFMGFYFHDAFLLPAGAGEGMQRIVDSMNRLMGIFLIVIVIVITLFHGWLTYKLLSKPIRDQFVEQASHDRQQKP